MEKNNLLPLLDDLSYESLYLTQCVEVADTFSTVEESKLKTLRIEKISSAPLYNVSVKGVKGNNYVDITTMTLIDSSSHHIVLSNVENNRKETVTIYFKNSQIKRFIYTCIPFNGSIFCDFAIEKIMNDDSTSLSPELLFEMAIYLFNVNRKQVSLRLFDLAFKYGLSYPSSFVEIGICYAKLGDTVNACKCYKKAIEIDSEYSLAYYNMGIINLQNDQFDDAIHYLDAAIEFKCVNISFAYFNRASARLSKTIIDQQRINSIDRVLKYRVDDTTTQSYLLCYDDIQKAFQYGNANDIDFLFLAGRICERIDKISDAKQYYLKAANLGDEASIMKLKAM